MNDIDKEIEIECQFNLETMAYSYGLNYSSLYICNVHNQVCDYDHPCEYCLEDLYNA